MYFVHLASNQSRLRLHVEDNGAGDGFSILGASCGGDVLILPPPLCYLTS
jgi:hypothetical protein